MIISIIQHANRQLYILGLELSTFYHVELCTKFVVATWIGFDVSRTVAWDVVSQRLRVSDLNNIAAAPGLTNLVALVCIRFLLPNSGIRQGSPSSYRTLRTGYLNNIICAVIYSLVIDISHDNYISGLCFQITLYA